MIPTTEVRYQGQSSLAEKGGGLSPNPVIGREDPEDRDVDQSDVLSKRPAEDAKDERECGGSDRESPPGERAPNESGTGEDKADASEQPKEPDDPYSRDTQFDLAAKDRGPVWDPMDFRELPWHHKPDQMDQAMGDQNRGEDDTPHISLQNVKALSVSGRGERNPSSRILSAL